MFGSAITPLVLSSLQLVTVPQPVVAQAEPAAEDAESLTMAEASAAAVTRALETALGLLWPDEPTPVSLAAYVPGAREQLWANAVDHLLWPTHLRFLEARCNDAGAVALLFEEIRPLLPRRYGYAIRGSMPTAVDDAWAGGTGLTSVIDDAEFIFQMGPDTFACP
jgi:hypothetical protein